MITQETAEKKAKEEWDKFQATRKDKTDEPYKKFFIETYTRGYMQGVKDHYESLQRP